MNLLKECCWHAMWAVVRGVFITLLVVGGAVAWRMPDPSMRPPGPPRRIEPVPGVEGLVLRSATCTRVVLRTDRAQQMAIMKEHLATLYSKFVSVRQRDQIGQPVPSSNARSDEFTQRWGDLLWSSLADDFGAEGTPYERIPASTWGIPTWCPIAVGWDRWSGTAWTAQITDGYGWPFHAMKSTVLVAELAEAPPHWKVAVRGGSPLFETDAWPCTRSGLSYTPWQRGAVPLSPIPFGMAVDIIFWGALSYVLVVMQWGVAWVFKRTFGGRVVAAGE